MPIAKLLPLLRAGVAAAPDRADLKLHLAKALFHSDRMTEIVDRLRPAVSDPDADPELLYFLGRAALATRDQQLAFDALRPAATKGFVRAFGYLAETLHRLNREDEALETALQGLQQLNPDFESLPVVARTLLNRGEGARLWALCVELRARGVWGGWLAAVMAAAAATLGRKDELNALVDPERWFSAIQLAVPDDFNQRLAAELLAHKSLSRLSSTKATRGAGGRIDRLQLAGGPLAQDLLARIRSAVEIYVVERQVFSDHPMIAQRSPSVVLNSWALTVHDDGHEAWHIHPFGWISGVYYAAVPNVEPADVGHPGAIEFGLYPFARAEKNLPQPRWRLLPKAGLLLLFPSYFAHRTWPTGVGEPRISVAFDICPSDAAANAQ